MSAVRLIAELVGWGVFALWLAGAVGLGDFVLSFGPRRQAPLRTVCECQSMGHPEQCDERAGCRWLRRLDKAGAEG